MQTSAEELDMNKNTPNGVCTIVSGFENLNCFDKNGKQLVTLQIPGIGNTDPGKFTFQDYYAQEQLFRLSFTTPSTQNRN